MNAKQMDLVTQGLERMTRESDNAAGRFLARVAQLDPELGKVFGGTGRFARARLQALARAAERGEDAPVVRKLARRWRPFPVGYRDYATVGAAVLWTLREVMGSGFTLAARGAWIEFHHRVVLLLRRAARIDLQHGM